MKKTRQRTIIDNRTDLTLLECFEKIRQAFDGPELDLEYSNEAAVMLEEFGEFGEFVIVHRSFTKTGTEKFYLWSHKPGEYLERPEDEF